MNYVKNENYFEASKLLKGQWDCFKPCKIPINWLNDIYLKYKILELKNKSELASPFGTLRKYIK